MFRRPCPCREESSVSKLWIVQVARGAKKSRQSDEFSLREGRQAHQNRRRSKSRSKVVFCTCTDCKRLLEDKMADRNARAEREQQEDLEEMKRTFREDAPGQEEAAAHAREAETERITRAILGRGEFLSEEPKEFLQEIEESHRLATGQLDRTIEGRLKSMKALQLSECERQKGDTGLRKRINIRLSKLRECHTKGMWSTERQWPCAKQSGENDR